MLKLLYEHHKNDLFDERNEINIYLGTVNYILMEITCKAQNNVYLTYYDIYLCIPDHYHPIENIQRTSDNKIVIWST